MTDPNRLRSHKQRRQPVTLKPSHALAFPLRQRREADMEGGMVWLGIIAGILGLSGLGFLFAAWAKARRKPR